MALRVKLSNFGMRGGKIGSMHTLRRLESSRKVAPVHWVIDAFGERHEWKRQTPEDESLTICLVGTGPEEFTAKQRWTMQYILDCLRHDSAVELDLGWTGITHEWIYGG